MTINWKNELFKAVMPTPSGCLFYYDTFEIPLSITANKMNDIINNRYALMQQAEQSVNKILYAQLVGGYHLVLIENSERQLIEVSWEATPFLNEDNDLDCNVEFKYVISHFFSEKINPMIFRFSVELPFELFEGSLFAVAEGIQEEALFERYFNESYNSKESGMGIQRNSNSNRVFHSINTDGYEWTLPVYFRSYDELCPMSGTQLHRELKFFQCAEYDLFIKEIDHRHGEKIASIERDGRIMASILGSAVLRDGTGVLSNDSGSGHALIENTRGFVSNLNDPHFIPGSGLTGLNQSIYQQGTTTYNG